MMVVCLSLSCDHKAIKHYLLIQAGDQLQFPDPFEQPKQNVNVFIIE